MLVTSLSSIAIFSGLSAGYLILKNLLTNEEEINEEIEVNNIIKYEYFPVENLIDETKKDNTINYYFVEGEKEGLKSCIGQDLEGNNVSIDLLEGHLLVGGASRWGKSNLLNVLITNIMRTYTPNEVQFAGCDLKKSDIYYFRKYKHFEKAGVSTNKTSFLNQIKSLKKEMDRRADILDKENYRNVLNYNEKNKIKFSYIVFIIDELVLLTNDTDCKELLHDIMCQSASLGVYFVLASQDFTKNTVGRCKINASQVIGFKVFDKTDSATLMGEGYNLQDITVKGRCKIKNSEGVTEVQTFYIDEDEIEQILKPYEK